MEELYTIEEVAQKMRVKPKTVYSWVCKGLLRPLKINRKLLRFTDAQIQEFVQSQLRENRIKKTADEIVSKLNSKN